MTDKYKAAMVLCGTGDAMGYKNGDWEFSRIDKILEDLEKLGGIDALQIQPPEFIVSDDTVMHNATARGLVAEAENIDKLFQNIHTEYCKCMKDMRGRAPGTTCTKFLGTAFENQSWKSTPFNQFGGGCGASMRSMCIGLAFPKEEQLSNLVIVAVEAGRMSHHCAMGYMGSVVGAAFTSFALQGIPAVQWGARIRDVVIPMAKQHVTLTKDRQPQENLESFEQFEKQFIRYLTQTKITNPTAETKPFFLEKYGYKERDDYYNTFSYNGYFAGSSGCDSVIIAYDALLYSTYAVTGSPEERWRALIEHGILHSGDNDSTGAICCAWYGALYGFEGVNPKHFEGVEKRAEMEALGEQLFKTANDDNQIFSKPITVGSV